MFTINMLYRQLIISADGAIYRVVNKAEAKTIIDNVFRMAGRGEYYACASNAFSLILEYLQNDARYQWNGFRGVDWGASREHIVDSEGREPDARYFQNSESPFFYGEKVSKFDDVSCAYFLDNNRLLLSAYGFRSDEKEKDFTYLGMRFSRSE